MTPELLVSKWGSLDKRKRIEMLDRSVLSGDFCAVLDFLAKQYPDPASQFEASKILLQVESLAPSAIGEPVEVIAAYYYHIDGGGIESALRTLADDLGQGYRSVVLTESGESAWADGSQHGDSKQIDNAVIISLERYADASRFERLKQALEEIRPDVLVYHAWFDENLLWDIALCHACGVRVVLNVHGVFSHFLEVSDGQRNPWSDGRLFASVPAAARLCDAVVSQSTTNQMFFSRFNPRSYAIAHKLPQVYEELLVQGREAEGSAKLLWVGRFDPYKHPEDAVDILARVRASVPEATLTYVGKSADGLYEEAIKAKAIELGVGDALSFEGFHADVSAFYGKADVLLSTTEVEGYCMVLAEAFAAGLPVVAYDMPYVVFAQCEGVSWVPQGDCKAAASAVIGLLSDADHWAAMSTAGQSFMRDGLPNLMPSTWADVIRDLQTEPQPAALQLIQSERTMWDTLFSHYLCGEAKTHAQLDASVSAADAASAEMQDLVQSYSYRVGKTVLAPLRFVKGKRK